MNFKKAFGFDYDMELPKIKVANIVDIVYPAPASATIRKWGRYNHFRHVEGAVKDQRIKVNRGNSTMLSTKTGVPYIVW